MDLLHILLLVGAGLAGGMDAVETGIEFSLRHSAARYAHLCHGAGVAGRGCLGRLLDSGAPGSINQSDRGVAGAVGGYARVHCGRCGCGTGRVAPVQGWTVRSRQLHRRVTAACRSGARGKSDSGAFRDEYRSDGGVAL